MTKATLYELLRVEQTATAGDIRKAYLVMAKKCHPDKMRQDDSSSGDMGEAFKALNKAYQILSDPQRRDRYDRTGVVDDEDSQSFQDAYERFRGVKVTEQDVERAEAEYRNSPDEEKDLIEFFQSHGGDVRNVLGFIIGSRDEDVDRFVQFWEQKLKDGTLNKNFAKVFKEAKGEIRTLEELDGAEEDLDDEDDEEEEDEEMDTGDNDNAEDDEDEDDGFVVSDEDMDEYPVESDPDEDDDEGDSSDRMLFTPGDAVQVRWKSGKSWYDAYILGVHKKDKTYDVEYVRGKTKENGVPASLVRAPPQRSESAAKKAKVSKANDDGFDPALLAALQKSAAQRNSNFDNFAAKYTKPSSKKSGK